VSYYSSGVDEDEDAMSKAGVGGRGLRVLRGCLCRCLRELGLVGRFVGDSSPRDRSVVWCCGSFVVDGAAGSPLKLGIAPRTIRVIAKTV
jgi:hypothetical protein